VRPPAGVLPTEVLEFSIDEFNFLDACARRIDLTPRSLKRLVNVYKLLKIIWRRPNRRVQTTPEVERCVVLLLALTGCYPRLMRDVIDSLGSDVEHGSAMLFADFWKSYQPADHDAQSERDWARLRDDVDALLEPGTPWFSPTLSLQQLDPATFNLVRSFSFVGDIGYETTPGYDVAPGNGAGGRSNGQGAGLPEVRA
jgi:hypothetical protein